MSGLAQGVCVCVCVSVCVVVCVYQCPEHREDSGCSEYEQAAQRLGVVGLHHLYDPQQGLHTRPPQVPHVQTLQIHQTRPAAGGERGGERDGEREREGETDRPAED